MLDGSCTRVRVNEWRCIGLSREGSSQNNTCASLRLFQRANCCRADDFSQQECGISYQCCAVTSCEVSDPGQFTYRTPYYACARTHAQRGREEGSFCTREASHDEPSYVRNRPVTKPHLASRGLRPYHLVNATSEELLNPLQHGWISSLRSSNRRFRFYIEARSFIFLSERTMVADGEWEQMVPDYLF